MVIATNKTHPEPQIIEVESTPEELASFRVQHEQAERNWAWLQTRIVELGRSIFGKNVCVSQEEIFVADTATEAIALAKAAHPDDHGRILHWFPHHRLPRIYAHSR